MQETPVRENSNSEDVQSKGVNLLENPREDQESQTGSKERSQTASSSESSPSESSGDINAMSSEDFFSQISGKTVHKPTYQKIGEKLKTLLVPKEQQHFVHFRKLFKDQLPEGDGLIMSFPCSYQAKSKEFPVHGRMYLTLTMIGFNCSLFGYEKKFVILLSDIVRIEKSSKFLANSIKIETVAGDHHNFGSFKGRDRVYSLVFRVWRMNLDPEKRDELVEENNADVDQFLPNVVETASNMSPSDTTSESSADNSFNLSASRNPGEWLSNLSTTASPAPTLISCPCGDHKGKLLVDLELPLTVEQSFQLLFTENEWLSNFEESSKRSVKKSTPWSSRSLTTKTRICKYNIELDKTFGPKSSDVTEIQTCTLINNFNEGYIVHKEASNEGVPYADSFVVECSYCITRISENSCRLKVHGGIIFKKSVFPFVKIVIDRSTIAGLSGYYNALSEKLKNDSSGLASVISKSPLDFEKLDETSEESVIVEEDFNLPLPEPTRTGKEVKDTVTTVISSDNRQMDTVIILLKAIIVIMVVTLFFNFYQGYPQRDLSASISNLEIAELKALMNSLSEKVDQIQKFPTTTRIEL